MRRHLPLAALTLILTTPVGLPAETYWPTWRGPTGNGVAPEADPPLTWSEEINVRWKVEIVGLGLASPIVWEDRVYLMTARPTDPTAHDAELQAAAARREQGEPGGLRPVEHAFVVMSLSRQDGRVVWERTVRTAAPHEGHHMDNSWASGSPVTDGEVLIAHFGSFGTYGLDLDGDALWEVDLGDMSTRNGFGEGSTPSIAGDRVIVNWDHEGDSFIVALHKRTGEELWRRSRDEVTSWVTPLILEQGGRTQAIVPATGRSRGYDVASGEVVWSLEGMTTNTIPSPVHRDGVVYLTSGFRGNMLQAVDLSKAEGELTNGSEAVLWTYDRDTPYVPSMLLYGDQLYFLKRLDNILTSLDAETGEVVYNEIRIDGLANVWSSPVGAAGRVYITSREGTTVVLEHGREYNVLATNRLDDRFDATPAIVDGEIYLRGKRYLYCIAAD
jgi:outer membrane protein assembly factor BamB